MDNKGPTRKLAAIMFTDIAGYTALAAKDEEKAVGLLAKQRQLLRPIVEEFNGSWLKEIGDGLFLMFPTVTSAVECSIRIQDAVKDIEDLNLRIAIHHGEVIEQEGDVFGDDVNVTSRIQPFAAVGGIVISGRVQETIARVPKYSTKYIGKPKLKGVTQDVKIYCITSHGLPETQLSEVEAKLEEGGEERASSWAIFKSQVTFGKVIFFAMSSWLIINSALFLITSIAAGNLFGFSLKPTGETMRLGILDFEDKSGNIDDILIRAIKSELYEYLQRYRELTLIGDFELSRLDLGSLSRNQISADVNADFLVSGSLAKADKYYSIDSELYKRAGDHIVTHYSQRFPARSLQETSTIIADSLSHHFAATLGLSDPWRRTQAVQQRDTRPARFGLLGLSFFETKLTPDEMKQISYEDETYRALIEGRQLLNKSTLGDNLNALVLLEEASLQDPTSGDLTVLLAEAYYQRGQLQSDEVKFSRKAEQLLSKAIASGRISTDGLAWAHYIMSKIFLDRGDVDTARTNIREAKKLNPSNPEIRGQFKEVTKIYLKNLEVT